MSRLWIFIIGLLSLYAVRADGFGYSPDGGLVSFGELTSTALLWHHTHMTHLGTPCGQMTGLRFAKKQRAHQR